MCCFNFVRMICFFPAICDYFPAFGYGVKLLFIVCISLLLSCFDASLAALEPVQNERPETPATLQAGTPLSVSCQCFNELNTRIRDGRTAKKTAQAELKRLLADVRDQYYLNGGGTYRRSDWVFPLSGHDSRAVGRGRRHGFKPRGYDFFSGNRHGGHPSYDIFIRDRNQDSLDDRNGKPVRVLSMTGGIVVALEKNWEQGSSLRGGKYIWIYDPSNELLVYYAHNGELSVELGEVVKPGDLLTTVGRSGMNAAKKRSPTHLHVTVLTVKEGRAEPLEVYRELVRARTVPVL